MANATHHFLASSFLPSDPNWTWRKTEARFARAGYGVRQSAVPNKLSTPFEGTADVVFKTLTLQRWPCAIVNLINYFFSPLCCIVKAGAAKIGGDAPLTSIVSIMQAFPKKWPGEVPLVHPKWPSEKLSDMSKERFTQARWPYELTRSWQANMLPRQEVQPGTFGQSWLRVEKVSAGFGWYD